MIYVTGDTHARPIQRILERVRKNPYPGNNLTEDDILIIAGDFGYLWFPPDHRDYALLESELDALNAMPFTILFLDGNHENFDRLDALPTIKKYRGTVGVVRDKIFHLRRGECYIINDKKILTIGGGISVDKAQRVKGVSWWERENISLQEIERAMFNVYDNKQEFDYIITHTGPRSIIDNFFSHLHPIDRMRASYPGADRMYDPTAAFLEELYVKHIKKYRGWFFAHLHMESHLQTRGIYGKNKSPRIVSIMESVLPITFFEKPV